MVVVVVVVPVWGAGRAQGTVVQPGHKEKEKLCRTHLILAKAHCTVVAAHSRWGRLPRRMARSGPGGRGDGSWLGSRRSV